MLLKGFGGEVRRFLRMIDWGVALRMLLIFVSGLAVGAVVIRWFLLWPTTG